MVIFPYYSHIFRDSYGSGMGVPENPIDIGSNGFELFVQFLPFSVCPEALEPTSQWARRLERRISKRILRSSTAQE